MNVGEELVAAYLEHIKGCEFVQKNLYTDEQGEIDVVGIDLSTKTVYVCEVALHLTSGLRYVNQKLKRPDTFNVLVKKFGRDITYANKYFADYNKIFMLWSPIVKTSGIDAKTNQMDDVEDVIDELAKQYSIKLEVVINKRFYDCIQEMRSYAKKETKEIKNPVLRMLQVEEYLKKHIK